MALQRDAQYPGRFTPANAAQPQGGFKNRSAPNVLDGSYLEESWLNDWSGYFSALLDEAGIIPNGAPDTALFSQYLDASKDLIKKESLKNFPRVNQIINGDFLVGQRGTVFSTNGYGIDQWQAAANPDGGALTSFAHGSTDFALGQTEVPDNPKRHGYFSGYVVGGGGLKHSVYRQRIESVLTLSGQTATLSFYAKGTIAGNITMTVRQNFGTGGSPSPAVNTTFNQNISLTTDWQKFTFTADIPSISGKTLGTNDNDYLFLEYSTETGAAIAAEYGTPPVSYQGTVSLADVQLEFGSIATAYDRLLIADALVLCQRYFQTLDFGSSDAILFRVGGANFWSQTYNFPKMRITPTTTQAYGLGLLSFFRLNGPGSLGGIFPFQFFAHTNTSLSILSTPGAAGDGDFYGSVHVGGAGARLSAELL